MNVETKTEVKKDDRQSFAKQGAIKEETKTVDSKTITRSNQPTTTTTTTQKNEDKQVIEKGGFTRRI